MAGIVLRAPTQHLSGFGAVAQGIVFTGQRPAQWRGQLRRILQPGEQGPGLVQLAALAQQLRAQQGHPRLARITADDLADDALHQFRLFQALRQPAETQPGLQVVG